MNGFITEFLGETPTTRYLHKLKYKINFHEGATFLLVALAEVLANVKLKIEGECKIGTKIIIDDFIPIHVAFRWPNELTPDLFVQRIDHLSQSNDVFPQLKELELEFAVFKKSIKQYDNK